MDPAVAGMRGCTTYMRNCVPSLGRPDAATALPACDEHRHALITRVSAHIESSQYTIICERIVIVQRTGGYQASTDGLCSCGPSMCL